MGFEELIKLVPEDSKVLEVGTNGLQGENTSLALAKRFKSVIGYNIPSAPGYLYQPWLHYPVRLEDFYKATITEKYDLIVLDLNLGNNLRRYWTWEGLARIHGLLNPGGFLINYALTKEDYQSYSFPNYTGKFIKHHMASWWNEYPLTEYGIAKKLNSLHIFRFVRMLQEEIRPYIWWCLLQK